jgi:hypothetical protein
VVIVEPVEAPVQAAAVAAAAVAAPSAEPKPEPSAVEVEPDPYQSGRRDAADHGDSLLLRGGRGLAGRDEFEFATLLAEEGIGYEVSTCMSGADEEYLRGYNDVMERQIARRHGDGFLRRTRRLARRRARSPVAARRPAGMMRPVPTALDQHLRDHE